MQDEFDIIADLGGIKFPDKACYKCLTLKSFDNFPKSPSNKSGRRNICKACHSKQTLEISRKDIEKTKQRKREWYNANKDHANKKKNTWYKENPEKFKNGELMRKYGITLEVFNSLVEGQGGKCKICSNVLLAGKHTHVDHCHKTGVVRGILCQRCNVQLGWFEKNASRVIKYLEQS